MLKAYVIFIGCYKISILNTEVVTIVNHFVFMLDESSL